VHAPSQVYTPPSQVCVPPLGMRALPQACAPRLQPYMPPPRGSRLPASASLIVPLPVRAPLFIRSRLSFIHMRPDFIRSRLSFICMRPYFICVRPYFIRVRLYFIRACPTFRPYAPLWQPFAPSIELLCALPPVQYNGSLHPAIQRGSDVVATVDKVTPVLPCQRSTWHWPLSDGQEPYRTWQTDERTCLSVCRRDNPVSMDTPFCHLVFTLHKNPNFYFC
jgi:hypothetical protein